MTTQENIKCPFCGEDDFDLIGLKMHLLRGYCTEYSNLKIPRGVLDFTRRTVHDTSRNK